MGNIVVLHNGGGWITNIGNAFLDFGSMQSIKEACPNADIHVTSVLNRWVSHHVNKGVSGRLLNKSVNIQNVFNLQDHGKVDYITQSGAFLGRHWFDLHGNILMKLKEKGIKLIINGGGMTDTTYCDEEIEKTRDYLKKINPCIFISRDELSFKCFQDLAEHSYNGIDCAFFLSDFYEPIRMDLPPYIVLNFDKRIEPDLNELNLDGTPYVIRSHHSFWHNFGLKEYPDMKANYYGKENILISEIPQDYLNVYGNSSATFSDRVHACVATVSYGGCARLYSNSPRSLLFDRIGANGITKKLVQLDLRTLRKEKEQQANFLSEIINIGD